MKLQDYTTEELRAELKRRSDLANAEKAKVKRCRMCKHWGAITYFGKPANYTIGNAILVDSSRQKTESITDATPHHNLPVSILNRQIMVKL